MFEPYVHRVYSWVRLFYVFLTTCIPNNILLETAVWYSGSTLVSINMVALHVARSHGAGMDDHPRVSVMFAPSWYFINHSHRPANISKHEIGSFGSKNSKKS